jgi:hypothetical protein
MLTLSIDRNDTRVRASGLESECDYQEHPTDATLRIGGCHLGGSGDHKLMRLALLESVRYGLKDSRKMSGRNGRLPPTASLKLVRTSTTPRDAHHTLEERTCPL